ncbi:MAG TPA: dihydroorotate dehydrogenase electron transfer subunit [Vicinamibacterales bacterium]|nr:dihydroorotate dehydrogenase electron transfer subunit [Vicinamibacterales bacterium]
MIFDVAAEVMANRRLSPDYNVIALRAPDIARAARPGQFVMIKTAPGLDPMLRRPFSIFELVRDEDGTPIGVSLLNKRVGVGTALLYEAREGIVLSLLGPLGQPFEPVGPDGLAWMVAGGVGLAPFATLAEALAARGTPMTLFYGARSGADLYYRELFESLGATVVLTTEDGSLGEKGRVTTPLERALAAEPADRPVTIYACGPTPMMRAVAAVGERAGRPVFVSLEPVMGCGMGGCYSCVVPVKQSGSPKGHFVRSCLEGPVFDAHRLVWDALPAGGH